MRWCLRSFSLIALRLLCVSLADALRIDDSDQTVLYQGTWSNGHEVPDDMSKDWDNTVHYSNSSGATATLTFTGTSIAVYGSIHPPGGSAMRSLYTIDDQQPSVAFTPPQEVPTSTHRTLFYSSPWFPYGEHTLVVTNLGDQFFLDFFDVQDESAPTSTSTALTSTIISSNIATWQTMTSSLIGASQTSPGPGGSITPTLHGSSMSTIADGTSIIANRASISIIPTPMHLSHSKSATLTTRAIAGVAVACVSLLMLAGLVIWFCRRKCIRGVHSESNDFDVSRGVDLNKEIVEATMFTRKPVTNASPSPDPSTPDVSEDASRMTPATTTALPSSSCCADFSPTIDNGLLRPSNTYPFAPNPGIATTKLEDPPEPLALLSQPVPPAQTPYNVRFRHVPATLCPSDEYCNAIPSVQFGQRARLPCIHADVGVRLAGGPPEEAPTVEEGYSDGWDDLPPPYQLF